MTHLRELLAHFRGAPFFNENLAADIEIAAHREASGLHSGLKIYAVIDYVGNELGVRQRLGGASPCSKTHGGLATPPEASGLHSGLKIHAVIDYVGNELGVRQRLVGASHDAKPDVVIATLHERRNNGVEWTLVSGERVRFGGIQQEECSAIVQEKSDAS